MMPPQNALKGKRIVVTRRAQAGKTWRDYLERRGAIVYEFPTIATLPVAPTKKLARILGGLDGFGWIIFTSSAGPHYMKELMEKMDTAMPPAGKGSLMPKIAVIGKKTSSAVRDIGYRAAFAPKQSTSAALARGIKISRGSILLLRADIASDELPRLLAARGANVVDVPIYKTELLRAPASQNFLSMLAHEKIDFLTFASPSAVRGFSLRLRKGGMIFAREIPALALGPDVARALRGAGFKKIRIASAATIESVTDAILGN